MGMGMWVEGAHLALILLPAILLVRLERRQLAGNLWIGEQAVLVQPALRHCEQLEKAPVAACEDEAAPLAIHVLALLLAHEPRRKRLVAKAQAKEQHNEQHERVLHHVCSKRLHGNEMVLARCARCVKPCEPKAEEDQIEHHPLAAHTRGNLRVAIHEGACSERHEVEVDHRAQRPGLEAHSLPRGHVHAAQAGEHRHAVGHIDVAYSHA